MNYNYKRKRKKSQPKDIIDTYKRKKAMMSSDQVFNNITSTDMSEKTIIRILDCSTYITAVGDESMKHKKVVKTNSCLNRFCSVCSWKKARKEALIVSICMNYIKRKHKKEFLFLTLTAPNVYKDDLKKEINKFNHSFKKMFARNSIKAINKGYVRKLEITYNKDELITEDYYNKCQDYLDRRGLKIGDENPNYNTYHLHFHVVVAVNKSYFTDRSYISQEIWLKIWRESMNDFSITQVHVRKISNESKNVVIESKVKKVVLEVAKYSTKDTDLHYNEDVFNTFYDALKGKQLITYNGLFKDCIKLYKEYVKIKDSEERMKHEIHEFIPEDSNEYIYKLLYDWGHGEYVEKEKSLLTKQERIDFNLKIIDEDDGENF